MPHDDPYMTETDTDISAQKYRAPALEKGLDVLELLAAQKRPMTLSQISGELGRSVSELFRMVQVLEARGYVASSSQGDGLELTNRLFSLGLSRGPSQNLLLSALPLMQALSDRTRQSCHLAIASEDQIVVIARIEAPGDLGFSVRVGYQRPIVHVTSGILLYAFHSPRNKLEWAKRLSSGESTDDWRAFEAASVEARAKGFMQSASEFVAGVIDIACPVFNDAGIIAALTIPHLQSRTSASLEFSLEALKSTAAELSVCLGASKDLTI
jgi:DNA-binding IclR family transcriptional regulator